MAAPVNSTKRQFRFTVPPVDKDDSLYPDPEPTGGLRRREIGLAVSKIASRRRLRRP